MYKKYIKCLHAVAHAMIIKCQISMHISVLSKKNKTLLIDYLWITPVTDEQHGIL